MENEQSGVWLQYIARMSVSFFAVFLMLFAASCNRDYGPSENRSQTFQSVPYAVPVPVRQPSRGYQNPYGNQQPYYYGTPNSRSYYNPYEFQQPYGRNPYSDYDQYYVPPTQYYNNEYDTGDSSAFSSQQ